MTSATVSCPRVNMPDRAGGPPAPGEGWDTACADARKESVHGLPTRIHTSECEPVMDPAVFPALHEAGGLPAATPAGHRSEPATAGSGSASAQPAVIPRLPQSHVMCHCRQPPRPQQISHAPTRSRSCGDCPPYDHHDIATINGRHLMIPLNPSP
ncbi:hypothetical protein SMALB_1516 [Streptomyces malaysiensis]|uniref:Uncharacterized protein n=1 Tax=Streptomyces malaysiensis TaxID=92644 RepID=A0A7X6AUT2_STRMQ|nr:hypothetical protein [Streptomyces malaysiensis]